MIVRELIAKLGIDFDKRGAREATAAIDKVKGKVKGLDFGPLAGLVSFGAIALGIRGALNEASRAQEAVGKMKAVFGDSTPAVEKWAETFGDAMGRSKTDLIGMASTFGMLIAPQQKSQEVAADWSKQLTKLAVDVAAFNDISEEEAFTKLFSGLSGESEAIKTIGVNLVQMDKQIKGMGIHKKWSDMTLPEKQAIYFRKIMEDTAQMQGHAKREAGSYANQLRRMDAAQKKLNESVGKMLMGPATKFVIWLSEAGDKMRLFAEKSNLVRAALVTLGGIALGFAARFAIANWPLLLFIATMVVVAGVIGEVMAIFSGKKSLIGTFFKELGDGIDLIIERTKWLRDLIQSLKDVTKDALKALGLWKSQKEIDDARKKAAMPFMRPNGAVPRALDTQTIKDTLSKTAPLSAGQQAIADRFRGMKVPETAVHPALQTQVVRLPRVPGGSPSVGGGATNNTVNMHVHGDPSPAAVEKMRKVARETMQGERRRTVNAATGAAAPKRGR